MQIQSNARRLAAAALALLLQGCATSGDPAAPPVPREDRQYVTGSNLPRRDGTLPGFVSVGKDGINDLVDKSQAATPKAER